MTEIKPVVIVHGGAGSHKVIVGDPEARKSMEEGVIQAARVGYNILMKEGSSLDAVESAVISLEDDPVFNAGRGSCLTLDGTVEMDASIMKGGNLDAGSVVCVSNITNPIRVARAVMEQGEKIVETSALVTEKAKGRLESMPDFQTSRMQEFYRKRSAPASTDDTHGTVGAVAVDSQGNVAYATSTGGINAKMPGRMGDSPVVGAGGYADNRSGAVSTTGNGEALLKTCLGRHITFLMEQGRSAQQAVEEGLSYMQERVGGSGGAIALTSRGDIGISFLSEGMSWAYVNGPQIHYGIYKGEDKTTFL
ncbi:Isoaspartyl peptidase/L-asparaginase [Lamellibrachia satsuma]|nr:Isoaspartyl peptidase/L-asparaginase [Lamellibrachia satsuma]